MRPRMAPVGPMRASVYWRRRIVVLVASIVALWLLWTLVATALSPYVDGGRRGASSGGDQESAAASEPTGGVVDARSTAEPRSTTPPSARRPVRTTQASGSRAAHPPRPRGTPSPTPKPTPPGIPVCQTDDLEVAVVAVKTTVPAGFPVPIRLQVTNTSTRACRVDIGPRDARIIVMTGSDRVWDTDHCPTAIAERDLRLAAGKTGTVTIVWNGRRSTPRCTDDAASSKPGAHILQAAVGGALSDPTSLTLR